MELFLAVVMGFVAIATIATAADYDIATEPKEIRLYETYSFPKGSIGEGIISLSFLIPGRMMKEKGLEGIWKEVIEKVLSRYFAKDRQGGMSEYWISIIIYPYEDIPAITAEKELNRIFLELLIAMRGQDA